jgi:hypothetical protein
MKAGYARTTPISHLSGHMPAAVVAPACPAPSAIRRARTSRRRFQRALSPTMDERPPTFLFSGSQPVAIPIRNIRAECRPASPCRRFRLRSRNQTYASQTASEAAFRASLMADRPFALTKTARQRSALPQALILLSTGLSPADRYPSAWQAFSWFPTICFLFPNAVWSKSEHSDEACQLAPAAGRWPLQRGTTLRITDEKELFLKMRDHV